MTVKEAIKRLEEYDSCAGLLCTLNRDTILMAIEALEKQIPKKVDDFMERSEEFGSFYKLDFMCPSCNKATICQPYKPNHCKYCGQKLDWGKEND